MSGIKTALNISEQEYRSLPYLSYSKIAKYEREGFMGYLALDDDESSPSLTFGSAVDCLLTEGKIAFENNYVCGAEGCTGKQGDILTGGFLELGQRRDLAFDQFQIRGLDTEVENRLQQMILEQGRPAVTAIIKAAKSDIRNYVSSHAQLSAIELDRISAKDPAYQMVRDMLEKEVAYLKELEV